MNTSLDQIYAIAEENIERVKARFAAKGVAKSYISYKENGRRYVLGYENGQFIKFTIDKKKGEITKLNNLMAYNTLASLHNQQDKIICIMKFNKDTQKPLKTFDLNADVQIGGVR